MGTLLHLEELYISFPSCHQRATGVQQIPAPACPGLGGGAVLRQQRDLFHCYLTHFAPAQAATADVRGRGYRGCQVGFGSHRIYVLAFGWWVCNASPLQAALCKGQGKQVRKSFRENTLFKT